MLAAQQCCAPVVIIKPAIPYFAVNFQCCWLLRFILQDEAQQLCKLHQLQPATPHAALCYLLQHCSTAVVTLGSNGCLAGSTDSSITASRRNSSSRAGSSAVSDAVAAAAAAADTVGVGAGDVGMAGAVIHQQPGVAGVQVVDVTGAGDMFAAG
jgi:sugar/nucleoside kinase (ribokinase family)